MASYNPDVLEHDVKGTLLLKLAGMTDDFVSKIATIVPSTHSIERYPWIGQTPALQNLASHGEVPYTSLSGKPYTLANQDWVGGLEFLLSDLEDDAAGLIKTRVDGFSGAYYKHRAKLAIDTLVNGSSSTLGIAYDGAPFFGSTHAALGNEGSTQDNTISNNGQTTAGIQTDLNSAIAKLFGFKDEAGDPMIMDLPELMIVAPPTLRKPIIEAVQAPIISNTSNVSFQGIKWDLRFNAVLTGNSWYVLNVGESTHPLIFQDRRGLDVAYEEDRTVKRVARWAASARYAAGYGPWQLAVKVI